MGDVDGVEVNGLGGGCICFYCLDQLFLSSLVSSMLIENLLSFPFSFYLLFSISIFSYA
jgi:hypothetical protein